MSADTLTNRETQILAEHAAGEKRTIAEGRVSARQALERLRSASACPTCGRSTFVFNAERRARRRPLPERVSPATHCNCPGGPAHGTKKSQHPLHTPQGESQ